MLSIAVMADKRRQEMVDYLLDKLGDVPVFYDDGQGIWHNRVQATLAYDKNATHHLVLQDDAILCKDFITQVCSEINKRPEHILNLYFGNRVKMREAAQKALPNGGYETNWLSWGVGIVTPTKYIEEMISYCNGIQGLDNHDDTRMARYIRHKGLKVWYPLPSLVDHRVSQSLMENVEGSHRVAFKFLGE